MWSHRLTAPALLLSVAPDGKTFRDAEDLLALLSTFTCKHSQKKAAEAEFTIWNDKRLLTDPRLFANAVWRFRYGLMDDLSPIYVMAVRELHPEYGDKQTVKVKLYDATMRVAQHSSSRNWGRRTSSAIAQAIAKKHGLQEAIESTKDVPIKERIQAGDTSDMQFLRDLAATLDFETFVTGSPSTLYFRKKPYGAPPRGVLTYFSDPSEYSFVLSFKPKLKGLGPPKTSGASTDKKATTEDGSKANQSLAPYEVSFDGESGNTWASKKDGVGLTKPLPSKANVDGLTHANRQSLLDGSNEAESEHCLTGSFVPGVSWKWQGDIDKPFQGKWYLEEVSVSISGTSARVTCSWKRNAKNDGTKAAKNAASNTEPSEVSWDPESGNTYVGKKR